jgi:hypothetical protein
MPETKNSAQINACSTATASGRGRRGRMRETDANDVDMICRARYDQNSMLFMTLFARCDRFA